MYPAFHENIFHAYFTEGLDIGSHDIIAAVAEKSGLDGKDTLKAVAEGRYADRLEKARREGGSIGLTGVPTLIVNKKYKVVGAQPIEVFVLFGKLETEREAKK